LLPSTTEEYVIADYQCEEFATLVESNTNQSTLVEQMKVLFNIMNRDWESQFNRFTVTKVGIPFVLVVDNKSYNYAVLSCILSFDSCIGCHINKTPYFDL